METWTAALRSEVLCAHPVQGTEEHSEVQYCSDTVAASRNNSVLFSRFFMIFYSFINHSFTVQYSTVVYFENLLAGDVEMATDTIANKSIKFV